MLRSDVVVIGGGQAGLAAAFYLRRAGIDHVVLDAQPVPGGAWPLTWNSLRLFSVARHSSLPGRPMPSFSDGYPTAQHVVDYLTAYEKRYDIPVQRPVQVGSVTRDGDRLVVHADAGTWSARHVISATGTWWRPFRPLMDLPGRQLHTVDYRDPLEFAGQKVVVVGGGNSGAQIAADLAPHTELTWMTRRPPRYMPDEIDGKALFDIATRRGGVGELGDIVAVPSVREARDNGLLVATSMDSEALSAADVVVWCTGFRPALSPLAPLRLRDAKGRIAVDGTTAAEEPRLHLLGYGGWTGPASATLIGVGPTAKATVAKIAATIRP
ncbi:ArsO family NAD(P)H-dependent flavin-containing monooxygenase [Lentzea sp. BCCO 10_0061]|uniref:ArsO family NAD(P)H-dependent flavin-containing monooxygenase n=1 Tax=Lentzea sokolovensis TaxID=3095429 RepID=A0ABU4UM62_9PSEU|nr:ArsO family NAD(P)H-dependent flavin-containing monooxygenase [Lentzea sp. BCCO 10_0061]MDX8140587.1 ArsO family NAD(P)H-dependent flavin-containing monooxygenase [Lentzea sp. BCCO 10_0061]